MKRLAAFLARFVIFVLIATSTYFVWGTSRYAPGEEPLSYFPVVLQSLESDPPRFELYRWRELKDLLLRQPTRSLALPVGDGQFELAPDQNFTPTVRFRVTQAGGGQRIEVTLNTEDYMFRGVYHVVGDSIVPERLRIGHGMMVMGAVFIGVVGTVFLGWLYRVTRWLSKRRSGAAASR
jgi:hypothetical protein